jgi:hypothetical protein
VKETVTYPCSRPERVKRFWLPALDALGYPHSRWHDLRHAAAVSTLATENIRDVSRWLGHAKISTTMDIYAAVLKSETGGKASPTSRPEPLPADNIVAARTEGELARRFAFALRSKPSLECPQHSIRFVPDNNDYQDISEERQNNKSPSNRRIGVATRMAARRNTQQDDRENKKTLSAYQEFRSGARGQALAVLIFLRRSGLTFDSPCGSDGFTFATVVDNLDSEPIARIERVRRHHDRFIFAWRIKTGFHKVNQIRF